MRICLVISAAVISLASTSAAAQGPDPFTVIVKAFTPDGALLSEQTASCDVAKPCRLLWSISSEGERTSISLSLARLAPGILQVVANRGPFRIGATRLANATGAVGEISATTQTDGGKALQIKFQVTRR